MKQFDIMVLAYGDYPELLQRCLGSLTEFANWRLVEEVQLGLNEVSRATHVVIGSWLEHVPVPVRIFNCKQNAYKYPLMRRMLYGHGRPIVPKNLMWFDDDSYLTSSNVLPECNERLALNSLVGRPYRLSQGYGGQQPNWIRKQPWYAGRGFSGGNPNCTWFPQGAWWAADRQFIQKWDWPTKELKHRGGDVMLGALLYQQQTPWWKYKADDVMVNADAKGQHSKSPRRGYDEQPLGMRLPPPPVDHDFECEIKLHRPKSSEPDYEDIEIVRKL